MLGNINPVPDRNDGWVWKLNQRGHFTSKSFYVEISHITGISIPHNDIWNPDIPSKVSFFIWNSYLDKMLTLNYLQSKGWNLANIRVLCIFEEESISHLFNHCSMAKLVWGFFLSHLKISWIFLKLFNELISCWWIGGLESFPLSIWRALPGVICWELWKERNNRIFEDKYWGQSDWLVFIYNTLFE